MTSASPSNLEPNPEPSLGPLNPGNVVSAAIRLYRDRLKMYLTLSFRAYLWLFVPIYGWAKYAMHTGVMSRLAVQELMNQPETPREAYRQIGSKLWAFLGLGILLLLIFFGAYMAIALVGILAGVAIGGLASYLLSALFGEGGSVFAVIVTVLLVVAAILLALLWIVGRLIVAEVPMSVEQRVDPSTSLGRSWQLSKKSIVRIQFVLVAAYLITLPITLVFGFAPQFVLLAVEPGTPLYWVLYISTLLLSFVSGIFVLPFWQIVKGVLYYDLRSRREGIDLKLATNTPADVPTDTPPNEPFQ